MIRKTLPQTQAATFSIDLPDTSSGGMSTPTGTGFFVSGDGWFLTAAHVVMEGEGDSATVRHDIDQAWLMKESRPGAVPVMCQHAVLKHVDRKNDFAILKVDFAKNSDKAWMQGRTQFPHMLSSVRPLEEGEPVYSFGYPLSFPKGPFQISNAEIGWAEHSPRTTSAIVSSNFEKSKLSTTTAESQVYVLDKALNYGNSGGPIIAQSTGYAHAVCTRFQLMPIRQRHLEKDGQELWIKIPSLYGIAVSLNNPEIVRAFREFGIPYTDETSSC